MRTPCCHSFVAFILKCLIFFQTFLGISIIVYSAYMLNQWEKHLPIPPSPPSPSPPPSDFAPAPSPDSSESVFSIFNTGRVSNELIHMNFGAGTISDVYGEINLESNSIPAPWFIYAFMGLGVVLCCISCIGHIAAEAINGCCLCFYTILKIVLILLEVALVAFIALDHRWEKDLPADPTGEIDSIRDFVQDNIDVCKWVGIVIIVVQVVSLLLALVLGMMASSSRKKNDDMEEGSGSESRGKAWEPLLNSNSNQAASSSTSGDAKAFKSDIWTSRIREKYGLNSNQSASLDRKV
ncbi:hypothetical protein LXL04_036803 [Taraxacum kok-saghyz]